MLLHWTAFQDPVSHNATAKLELIVRMIFFLFSNVLVR